MFPALVVVVAEKVLLGKLIRQLEMPPFNYACA